MAAIEKGHKQLQPRTNEQKSKSKEGFKTSDCENVFNMTRQKKINTGPTPDSPPDGATLPPGPSGLPCVGSLLEWKGPETNLAWTKRYGSTYYVKMASKNLVYLNSVELVEQYMEGRKGERYLDRPMGPGAIAEGLLFGSGEAWKKNKRAFMKALYTVTFSAHMEEAVQSEIKLTMGDLEDVIDKPIKIGDFLLATCANSITGLLLGESLPPASPDRTELLKIARRMEGVDLNSLFTQISLKHPKLREPLSKLLFKDIVDVHGTSRKLQNLLRQWIRQATSNPLSPTSPRTKTHTPSNIPEGNGCPFHYQKKMRVSTDKTETESGEEESSSLEHEALLTPPRNDNLIESSMQSASHLVAFGFTSTARGEQPFEEIEPPSDPNPVPYTPITEKQWTFDRQMSLNLKRESILQRILKQPEFEGVTEGTDADLLQSLIDMFFGGVTSTLAAIEYVLAYLTKHQDFQRLAQKEIDEHMIKHNGFISWAMRDDMHYVRACITEALRLGSVTPSSLPHVSTKDTEIEGYSIPKGTFVVASIYSLHRDPSHYIDPEVFRPQRHLIQGRFKSPTSYKPYGVGARRCVGDKMAEMQLFLYTVYILRDYELHPISSKSPTSFDTHMRIINRLKDFRCVLKKRNV